MSAVDRKRGGRVVYIGPSWGAWQSGRIADISSFRIIEGGSTTVDLWFRGSGIDNQRFPLNHIRAISDTDHVHCPGCCHPDVEREHWCMDAVDNDCPGATT